MLSQSIDQPNSVCRVELVTNDLTVCCSDDDASAADAASMLQPGLPLLVRLYVGWRHRCWIDASSAELPLRFIGSAGEIGSSTHRLFENNRESRAGQFHAAADAHEHRSVEFDGGIIRDIHSAP